MEDNGGASMAPSVNAGAHIYVMASIAHGERAKLLLTTLIKLI